MEEINCQKSTVLNMVAFVATSVTSLSWCELIFLSFSDLIKYYLNYIVYFLQWELC